VDDFELLAKTFDLEDIPSSKFQLQGARIGFLKTHVWDLAPAGPGLHATWTKAKDLLSQHGATVEEIEWPDADFEKLTKWHRAVMNGEGRSAFYGRMSLSSSSHDMTC
jgi:Asp-tRNA(Asn)/Glu-tRNA(Gln) amidotransferase A subunit family amidase